MASLSSELSLSRWTMYLPVACDIPQLAALAFPPRSTILKYLCM